MRQRALLEMGLAPSWVRRLAPIADRPQQPAAPLAAGLAPLQLASLDLVGLRHVIEHCEACPRAAMRSNALAGEGVQPVRLMVIDHVPSRHDARHGALRGSDAARLFEQLLFSIALKRDAIYLTHALRCDGALPTAHEASRCAPYLEREIELLAPHALLALGDAAGESLALFAEQKVIRLFVVPHPEELLQDASKKRAAWSTLRALRDYLAAG